MRSRSGGMNLSKSELPKLSRVISHALRHEPWLYELELDEEGWVSTELLLTSLRRERTEWLNLGEDDLVEMIATSDKKRHEIRDGKIRAVYGHSLPGKLSRQLSEPPKILYHGTSPDAADIIRTQGLKPMSRQYVHLSVDMETARQVGQRKAKLLVILTVKSHDAHQAGLNFYQGNDSVWLADFILPEFIEFPTTT